MANDDQQAPVDNTEATTEVKDASSKDASSKDASSKDAGSKDAGSKDAGSNDKKPEVNKPDEPSKPEVTEVNKPEVTEVKDEEVVTSPTHKMSFLLDDLGDFSEGLPSNETELAFTLIKANSNLDPKAVQQATEAVEELKEHFKDFSGDPEAEVQFTRPFINYLAEQGAIGQYAEEMDEGMHVVLDFTDLVNNTRQSRINRANKALASIVKTAS